MQRSWVHQEAASVWTGPAWIATVGGGPCLALHPGKSSVCPDKRRGHVGKGEGCPLAWGLLRKDL